MPTVKECSSLVSIGSGNRLGQKPAGLHAGYHWPQVRVHRGRLQDGREGPVRMFGRSWSEPVAKISPEKTLLDQAAPRPACSRLTRSWIVTRAISAENAALDQSGDMTCAVSKPRGDAMHALMPM